MVSNACIHKCTWTHGVYTGQSNSLSALSLSLSHTHTLDKIISIDSRDESFAEPSLGLFVLKFNNVAIDNKRTSGVRIDLLIDPNVRTSCDNRRSPLFLQASVVDRSSICLEFPADRFGVCSEGTIVEQEENSEMMIEFHKQNYKDSSQAKWAPGIGAIPMKSLKLDLESKELKYLLKFDHLDFGFDNSILSPTAREEGNDDEIASLDVPLRCNENIGTNVPDNKFKIVPKHFVTWCVAFEYSGATELTRKKPKKHSVFEDMMAHFDGFNMDEDGE